MDLSSCASDPLMYYADKTNIRSYDLGTGNTRMLLPSAFKNGIAMDVHHSNQKLYIGDAVTKEVYSVDLSASSLEPALEVLLSNVAVYGLAVDWINNNLYWTDTGKTLARGRARISVEGTTTLGEGGEGVPTYVFAKFSEKLHEIETFLGREGGTRPPPPIHQCLHNG